MGADPQTDIAVLRIEGKDLPTASLGDSSSLHVGDIVMAFGNPFGLNFTLTRGAVSALNRSEGGIEDTQNFIHANAPINPGDSGCPLVNVQGQVVGINTAIWSGQAGPRGEDGFILWCTALTVCFSSFIAAFSSFFSTRDSSSCKPD